MLKNIRHLTTGEEGFLNLLRLLFVALAGFIGWSFASDFAANPTHVWAITVASIIFALFFTWFEKKFASELLGIVSLIIIGLLAGFLVSFIFYNILFLLPFFDDLKHSQDWEKYKFWLSFCLTILFSYLSIAVLIQCRDDFKFIIPFVELVKEKRWGTSSPITMDTSAIIDGRLPSIIENNLIDNLIIIPRFVLEELQKLSDSPDKIKRERGRFGFSVLDKLQNNKKVRIEISDVSIPLTGEVDQKLIKFSKSINAKIITTDFNLGKLAAVEGVEVININLLANALRPAYLPGEKIELKLLKPGENMGQGVGFLEDGTMVVVEGGFRYIGQVVTAFVSSTITTTAGRIIFAQMSHPSYKGDYPQKKY